MALMLRKACQPLLNKNDFDAFHADIGDDNYLWIFTPCGKPLMPVFGVRFTRSAPTPDEIEYVPELLETWLEKNRSSVNKFLDALEDKERNEIPPDDSRFEKYNIGYDTSWDSELMKHRDKRVINISLKEKNVLWTLNMEGNLQALGWPADVEMDPLKPIRLSKAAYDEAMVFAHEVNDNLKYSHKLEAILADLNTCNSSL